MLALVLLPLLAAPPAAPAADAALGTLRGEIARIAAESDGRLGFAVFLRSSYLGEAEREAVAAKVAKAAATAFSP